MGADVFVPFVFFGFLGAIILVPIWLKERTKRSAHALISQALEKGQQLDPAILRQLTESGAKPVKDRARSTLGSGVVLLALAVGFVIGAFAIDLFVRDKAILSQVALANVADLVSQMEEQMGRMPLLAENNGVAAHTSDDKASHLLPWDVIDVKHWDARVATPLKQAAKTHTVVRPQDSFAQGRRIVANGLLFSRKRGEGEAGDPRSVVRTCGDVIFGDILAQLVLARVRSETRLLAFLRKTSQVDIECS